MLKCLPFQPTIKAHACILNHPFGIKSYISTVQHPLPSTNGPENRSTPSKSHPSYSSSFLRGAEYYETSFSEHKLVQKPGKSTSEKLDEKKATAACVSEIKSASVAIITSISGAAAFAFAQLPSSQKSCPTKQTYCSRTSPRDSWKDIAAPLAPTIAFSVCCRAEKGGPGGGKVRETSRERGTYTEHQHAPHNTRIIWGGEFSIG
jgi:hypothetical protein